MQCRFSVLVIYTCCCLLLVHSTGAKFVPNRRSKLEPADQHSAMKRLLKVFGVADPLAPRDLQTPPQYMLDLYKRIADDGGVTKAPNPYNAKVIRSFTDKESDGNHVLFNISGLGAGETLLEAELHLYTLRSNGLQPHVIFIYQVLDPEWVDKPERNRLVDVRYVSGSTEGWQVFRVKSAVKDWISDVTTSVSNWGLSIVAASSTGQPVPLRISRRCDRHANHQPVLVLFNDDPSGASGNPLSDSSAPSNGKVDNNEVVDHSKSARHRRQTQPSPSASASGECHRQELYVDFESIGWSEWIIAPKGYNAYHCSGVCWFPLGQNQKPTNHATVQSIVHEMQLIPGVARPCCVPSRLLSLSLLYYDENDNVILKQYDDMVADACGCH